MANPDFTAEELLQEEWRPAPVYHDTYAISNLGRVRRERPGKATHAGRIKATGLNNHGYRTVTLSRDGRNRTVAVHRLVALAFLGPCPVGMEVNHKNFDRSDARATNLEYKTRQENVQYSMPNRVKPTWLRDYRNVGEAVATAKLTEESVRALRATYSAGGVTYAELGRLYGVSEVAARKAALRHTWQHVR